MNKTRAITEITKIFSQYGVSANLPGGVGKIYELYCLSRLIEELDCNGFSVAYKGANPATFKAGPGYIHSSDPHFDLSFNGKLQAQIYLNIEFETIGSSQVKSSRDRSCYHELDIVIVETGVTGRPNYYQIFLAAECKSTANFRKSILKETLGIRRELAIWTNLPVSSLLTSINTQWNKTVKCDPPSEYYIYFVDPAGSNYQASPETFDLKFLWDDP